MTAEELYEKAKEYDRNKDRVRLDETTKAMALIDLRSGAFNDSIAAFFRRHDAGYSLPDFSSMSEEEMRDAYLDILAEIWYHITLKLIPGWPADRRLTRKETWEFLSYLPAYKPDIAGEPELSCLGATIAYAFLPPFIRFYKIEDRKAGRLRDITEKEYNAMFYDDEGLHEYVVFGPPR